MTLETRVAVYLQAACSEARAHFVAREGLKKLGADTVLSWGRVIAALKDDLPDPPGFLLDRLCHGEKPGLMNECVRQGDVEGAVKAYYGRRSQKAQEEPRGPFPITDVQSLWLRGLLQPMPQPRAWDYWTLQRTA